MFINLLFSVVCFKLLIDVVQTNLHRVHFLLQQIYRKILKFDHIWQTSCLKLKINTTFNTV